METVGPAAWKVWVAQNREEKQEPPLGKTLPDSALRATHAEENCQRNALCERARGKENGEEGCGKKEENEEKGGEKEEKEKKEQKELGGQGKVGYELGKEMAKWWGEERQFLGPLDRVLWVGCNCLQAGGMRCQHSLLQE